MDRQHSYLQLVLLLIYYLSGFPIFNARSRRYIAPLQASEKSHLTKQRKLRMWQYKWASVQSAELTITPFKRLYCSPLLLLSLSLVLNGRGGEYVAAIDLSGISAIKKPQCITRAFHTKVATYLKQVSERLACDSYSSPPSISITFQ